MKITEKTDITIKVFCIVILLVLNIAVYVHGKDLSCDKCQITFTSQKQTQREQGVFQKLTVNMTDLYDYYINERCIVTFDKIDGYKYGITEIK